MSVQQHTGSDQDAGRRTGQVAQQEAAATAQQTRESGTEVARTVREQAGVVAGEAKHQAREVTGQVGQRIRDEVDQQARRLSGAVREWSDELASMSEGGTGSPVRQLVRQVADGGRRTADRVEQGGVTGLVRDVESFARRRPGAFLLGAAVAGLLVGRATKAARQGASTGQQQRDEASDVSAPGAGAVEPANEPLGPLEPRGQFTPAAPPSSSS
jgi:hypothetical protein